MKNIIITSVGRRVQLIKAFVRALEESEYDGKIITVDAGDYVPAAYFGHIHYKAPGFDSEEYIPALLDICRKEQAGMIIPLHEKEFPLLAWAKKKFAGNGTLLLLSSEDVLATCQDKYKTYLFFNKHGFRTPQSFLPAGIEIAEDLKFPLFIKPRTGMGSANTFVVKSRRELDFFLNYVDEAMVQEYIDGTEYTMDVLNDLDGRTISVAPRVRMEVRSGEVSKSRTVKDWELINQTRDVSEALGGIGPLTVQAFRKTDGEIVFTEINPRFGGGVPLSIQAGVDYPKLLAKMMAGEKVPAQLGEFTDNLYMLRYDDAIYMDNVEVGSCFGNNQD